MEFWISAVIFIIALIIVLAVVLIPYFEALSKNKKASDGIVNYDVFMRRFCYKIQMTQEEIFKALSVPSVLDEIEYQFDANEAVIIFTVYNTKLKYRLSITEFSDYSILKAEKIDMFSKGPEPNLINPFWVRKLNAIPIAYRD